MKNKISSGLLKLFKNHSFSPPEIFVNSFDAVVLKNKKFGQVLSMLAMVDVAECMMLIKMVLCLLKVILILFWS